MKVDPSTIHDHLGVIQAKRGIGQETTWNDIVEAFHAESDRAAAILAGAFLENHFRECLTAFFVDDKRVLELFETYKPLGSFQARVDIAFAMGLVPKIVYKDLKYIVKIRNHFAHHMGNASFTDQSVKDLCLNLSSSKPIEAETKGVKHMFTETSPRLQYLGAVATAFMGLWFIMGKEPRRTFVKSGLILEENYPSE